MTKASKSRKRKRLATAREEAAASATRESFATIGHRELARLQARSYNPSVRDPEGRVQKRLEDLIRATPGPADLDRALLDAASAVAAERRANLDVLPHQDKHSHELLTKFVSQIEASCRRAGLEPLPATAIGTIHDVTMNAFAKSLFGATAIVGVNVGAFVFAHLLAKAVAALISRRDKRGHIRIGSHPGDSQFVPASKRLAELALAFAVDGNVASAPQYICKDKALTNVANALRNGFEFFLVAHEYGHLMIDHGKVPSFKDPEAVGLTHEQEMELGADLFALAAALWTESPVTMMPMVLSPMILMKFLSMLERDGVRHDPETHPPSALRLEAMRMLMRPLGSNNESRRWVAGVLRVDARIDKLLERAWARNIETVRAAKGC